LKGSSKHGERDRFESKKGIEEQAKYSDKKCDETISKETSKS